MITNNYTNQVLRSIDENPKLLEELLRQDPQDVTRGGQSSPLVKVLGNNVSHDDLNTVSYELSQNPVIQLYNAASGSLDAEDLVKYVGGVNGTRASSNQAVRALFDGRLDLKEILLIIVLLKLFKRKQANTYNNSAIGLLGSLLGYNNQNSYSNNLFSTLLGGNSYSTSGGLFGSLLGGNSYNTGGLFGNSYSNNYYGNNGGLSSFLGLGNSNNSGLQNLLNFVNGNYNNNSQYNLLYNILSNAAGNAVNNNGVVSSSGLFSVLSQLLGF